ncbi:NAD(P)H-hydrate dehydratase [Pseudoteredinibacter isoporae]|nr:NAD(P)H-hydrate dehydratase [Pseudoteredinibacter isoporae]NHO86236.1 NAD(P)H-hydrate dehydratase [Pseudoteredinibacter isoporae]NIB25313.1 NAD(P)H-hydrate dehydratase [Pseudoteredinibacter isoporae]
MYNHTQSQALPRALYTAEQVKALDQAAINELGIPGIKLMKRAGRAAFERLLQHWPETDSLTVYCGGGNNAGDGYVVAALAAQKRIAVDIVQLADPEKLPADAYTAYQFARQEGVIMAPFQEHGAIAGEVVVDGLLGIGASGAPRGDYAAAIRQINEAGKPVLALDIPSGLCADSGHAEDAVKADVTVCFIGLKRGLLTARGPKLCGRLYYHDLACAEVCNKLPAGVERIQSAELLARLPAREADAHKGRFGHVLVVGGDYGFAGAALLSAESAARCGAGLVSVATRAEHISAIISRRPELMAHAVVSGQELEPLLEKATVVVIGPGLGRSPWSEQLLQKAADYSAEHHIPMVMDADALNMLAEGRVLEGARDNWVLTPHPGEAARLLKSDIPSIENDRFESVAQLQQRYGGAVLLKGAGSLICCNQAAIGLASVGNPGMATAGMGDVLSGVIAALIAQGMSVGDACRLGVCLHGDAGDLAADEFGQRGMLAADLIPYLAELLAES